MKRATTIAEMPQSFRPDPLTQDQLDEFYEDTIEIRTGHRGVSGIEDIYDSCHEVREHNAHLLMGHWGCGKSTELNRLAKRLKEDGFLVKPVFCKQELDIINIEFTDIAILLAEAVVQLAEEQNCPIKYADLKILQEYQSEIVKESELDVDAETELEAGISVETPKLFHSLLSVFARLKSSLKYKETSSTVIRTTIRKNYRNWIDAVNRIADQLTDPETGKQPILIFEDLDKGEAGKAFSQHGEHLSSLTFPVIYTFPISLSYLPEFRELEPYFQVFRLPMIEVRDIKGNRNPAGFAALRAIVKRRAELSLFAPLSGTKNHDVLDLLIEKTGGSLRNLFQTITDAAKIARRRGDPAINEETAGIALEHLQSDLAMSLSGDDYEFLRKICQGEHRSISDQPHLQKMMQAGAVLEYNGSRWHDVHPLIVDFLREIQVIKL